MDEQQSKRRIALTQADLDAGLSPEKLAELRAMLNISGFLREGQRRGWVNIPSPLTPLPQGEGNQVAAK